MQSIANIDPASLANTLANLIAAVVLGGLIGFERQVRQRTAGLRTNILVCLGAALFVDIAVRYYNLRGGSPSPLHVVAYVVSGVGFLGAGVIMRDSGNVRGLDTAATLWGSAAVGCAVGLNLLLEAILGAAFILSVNTVLRSITFDDRSRPPRPENGTHFYTFILLAKQKITPADLAALREKFTKAGLPLQELDVKETSGQNIEIHAVSGPTALEGQALGQLIDDLNQEPYLAEVSWRLTRPD